MPRDRMDDAIDRIAAGMTEIEDDPTLAGRIAAALPDRIGWFGWLIDSWAPRLALLAVMVAVAATWNVRGRSSSMLVNAAKPVFSSLIAPVPAWEPLERSSRGTKFVERLEAVALLEPSAPAGTDHERGLERMAVEALVPRALETGRTLTLAPLVIADLPMTAETFQEAPRER